MTFQDKIGLLEHALSQKNHLITNDLQITQKWGLKWICLCLLKPFYLLFNRDIYSHVRVNNVARSLFSEYILNQKLLNPELKTRVVKIIQTLNTRTHHKYDSTLQKIIKNLTALDLPQPKSCRPKITYRSDSTLKWPTDLTHLGITEAERKKIDFAINDIRASGNGTISFPKKRIQFEKNNQVIKDHQLPISVAFSPDQKLYLFPKTVFAAGGERKIKWCYDLTNGTYLLKKRCVGPFEKLLIQNLNESRKLRGIVNTTVWRSINNKLQMLENLSDGTLSILFGTTALAKLEDRISLIKDVLDDLHDLHKLTLQNVSINNEPIGNYPAFHLDIKFGNFLVREENGKWRGYLCDFGGVAGNPIACSISTGFTSPEYINFYTQKYPFGIKSSFSSQQLIDFNQKLAQKRDIWATGLLILSILVNKTLKAEWMEGNQRYWCEIAPLKCIQKRITSDSWGYNEKLLGSLTQQEIDAELDVFKKEIPSAESLFKLINQMLQVNPGKRISYPVPDFSRR